MKLEQLHSIVQMLDSEQVSLVRKTLSVKGKKSKYLTLFASLVGAKRWTPKLEGKIRKAGLEKADHYYIARTTVLERIVGVLAGQFPQVGPKLDEIKVAFHLEAYSYGEKTLIAALESAQNNRNYTHMLELFYFVKELKDSYEIQVELPSHIRSEEDIKESHARGSELLDMLQLMRESKHQSHLQKQRTATALEVRIHDWNPDKLPHPIDWMRVRAWSKLTTLDFVGALHIQERLVKDYLVPGIPFVSHLKERELLMIIKLKLGQKSGAEEILWELNKLDPHTKLETRIHRKYLIKNSILFSFSTYQPEAIRKAWEGFIEWREFVPRHRQPVLILSCVQLFLANQNFKAAKRALNALDDLKRSEWSHVKWQVALFRLFIHTEMGEVDLLESLSRSAEVMARQSDLQYPILATSALRYIGKHGEMDTSISEKYLADYSKCILEPAEERATHFFNLETYLLSKQAKISMADIELSRLSQGGRSSAGGIA